MARIVVCGYMLRYPLAGNVLAYFHYVLGLARLGHEVVYLEESGWPYSCYDPNTMHWGEFPTTGLATSGKLLAEYGLDVPLVYVSRESGSVSGMSLDDVARTLQGADLLLNIGGVCWLPEFMLCERRALVDMDPLFTQAGEFGAKLSSDYTVYHTLFSYGANIGRAGCTVPTLGLEWLPAVPPVVLELWHGAQPPEDAPFTTVANWNAYGTLDYEGESYGQKDREYLQLLDLPRHTHRKVDLALSGAPADVLMLLAESGWSLRDGGEVSRTVGGYHHYIHGSLGEFSAAKHAYVKTRSGWFSDRSVCYLASGLPVVLQDTGYTDWLPSGRGVLSFSTLDEAADALEEVAGNKTVHRRAATELAADIFDYRVVLPRLLDQALGSTAPGQSRAGIEELP